MAVSVAFADFLFALMAGFTSWGAIGYLMQVKAPEAYQSSSVGLAFIALPAASAKVGMGKTFGFFAFLLWFSGLDSSFCYLEGFVTNFLDLFNENRMDGGSLMKRALMAAIISLMGIALSGILCTNFGWVLFDMIEHYVADYLIVPIGLLQCVCVGW